MNWKKSEVTYLEKNYPKNIPLEKISKKIKKTVKAIKRKAEKMKISRPRFPSNRPSKRTPKNIIDRRYYKKNKRKVHERKMIRRKKLKEELIKILGGKCQSCGYNKCDAAFDFHHKEGTKENNINWFLKNSSKEKLLKEAKKCVLLCANCHRELHHRGAIV